MLTITVDTIVDEIDTSNAPVSLRDAISLADQGETIDFAPSLDGQTIRLTLGELAINQPLVIDATALPNGLTVVAHDPSDENGDGNRIFHIVDGGTGTLGVELRGLTLTGGDVSGSGGGILSQGNLRLVASTILDNSAQGYGGGIAAYGRLEIQNSTISENAAYAGGGIESTGEMVIQDSTISSNSAQGYGGGGIRAYGDVLIQDSTISSNSASNGGGLQLWPDSESGGSNATIEATTLAGNSARRSGGGIDVSDFAAVDLVNSTISGNSAGGDGGGVYARRYSQLYARLSTITGNRVIESDDEFALGGGVYAQYASAYFSHSIVAGNEITKFDGDTEFNDVWGDLDDSSSFNLIGVDRGLAGISDGVDGNQIGTVDEPLNPLLGPLADNGGPTLTHALLTGSPAIDAGDPDVDDPPPTDQRGSDRIVDGLGDGVAIIDVGSVELGLGTLSGAKFEDANGNSLRDVGELGLAGWTVRLDLNDDGTIDRTTTTDASGNYQFTSVPAGIHRVTEQQQPYWAQTFPSAMAFVTGISAVFVTSADLDGRNGADLIVVNDVGFGLAATVSILYSDGQGGLSSPEDIDLAPQSHPRSVVAADLVGDGKLDLAVATIGDGTNTSIHSDSIVILENLGNRQFRTHGVYRTCPTDAAGLCSSLRGRGPISLTEGDLNGDGHRDLVTANFRSDDVSVLLQDESGDFILSQILPVGSQPVAVAIGHLDPTATTGANALDLVVANHASNSVSVLLGQEDGWFHSAATLTGFDGPSSLLLDDLDGDNQLDLVVTNRGNDRISVLAGTGDSSFGARIQYSVGNAPSSVAAGDVNRSGRADLVVANSGEGSLSLLRNESLPGSLAFDAAEPFWVPVPAITPYGVSPLSVHVSQLDNDEELDIATAFGWKGASVAFGGRASHLVPVLPGQEIADLDFGNQFVGQTSLSPVELAVTMTSSTPSVALPGNVAYTVVVSNSGPHDAVGAQFTAQLDEAIRNVTYVSSASDDAAGNSTSGSGNIDELLTIAAGGSVEYTIIGELTPSARRIITSHATVATPADRDDTNPANNAATIEVAVIRPPLRAGLAAVTSFYSPLDGSSGSAPAGRLLPEPAFWNRAIVRRQTEEAAADFDWGFPATPEKYGPAIHDGPTGDGHAINRIAGAPVPLADLASGAASVEDGLGSPLDPAHPLPPDAVDAFYGLW